MIAWGRVFFKIYIGACAKRCACASILRRGACGSLTLHVGRAWQPFTNWTLWSLAVATTDCVLVPAGPNATAPRGKPIWHSVVAVSSVNLPLALKTDDSVRQPLTPPSHHSAASADWSVRSAAPAVPVGPNCSDSHWVNTSACSHVHRLQRESLAVRSPADQPVRKPAHDTAVLREEVHPAQAVHLRRRPSVQDKTLRRGRERDGGSWGAPTHLPGDLREPLHLPDQQHRCEALRHRPD